MNILFWRKPKIKTHPVNPELHRILTEGRAKIVNGWTQRGTWAGNAKGEHAFPNAPDATTFCAYGACMAAANTESIVGEPFSAALGDAYEKLHPASYKTHSLTEFNDKLATKADILAIYDEAIANA